MATTVGNFSAIDDSEVDAESPITETLVTRLRDNSYWIDAGTRQTTITDTSKVLKPDGAGGVTWGTGGANGTNSAGTLSSTSGSPTQIAIIAGSTLILHSGGTNEVALFINSSNDSYASAGISGGPFSGTISGSYATATNINVTSGNIYCKKTGSNYEFYGDGAFIFCYLWI